jgi:hypothetical protein
MFGRAPASAVLIFSLDAGEKVRLKRTFVELYYFRVSRTTLPKPSFEAT